MPAIQPRSASQSIGNYTSHRTTARGVAIQSSAGILSITLFTPEVVQVRFTAGEPPEDFSYAVIAQPQTVPFTVSDSSDYLLIKTDQLQIKITKAALRISIADAAGNVLNEDDPGLGIQIIGEQINCYKKLQEDERFIGLGEKNGPLDKRGRGYINWNTDAYAYSPDADPLYCSVPFYIGVHHQKAYGLYFDNSYRSTFNFGASNDRFSSFSADGGEMKYYFIGGNSPDAHLFLHCGALATSSAATAIIPTGKCCVWPKVFVIATCRVMPLCWTSTTWMPTKFLRGIKKLSPTRKGSSKN
jgi:alpha-glucosidase